MLARALNRGFDALAARVEAAPRPALIAQIVHVAGDAGVAVALAQTLFFDLPVGEARLRVGLYLALAIAPYALMAPLVTRFLAGRVSYRGAIFLTDAGRGLLSLLLFPLVHTALVYPIGFAILVLSRAHSIARNSLLPDLTDEVELVPANAGVSIASGVAGLVGGGIAAGLAWAFAQGASLLLSVVVFALGAGYAVIGIPRSRVSVAPADDIVAPRTCRAAVIGLVGAQATFAFTVFLYAFSFRSTIAVLPVLFAVAALAGFAATFVAPRAARSSSVITVVHGALALVALGAIAVPKIGSIGGALVYVALVAFAARAARIAFDSVVQREAERRNRATRFAQYEVAGQLAWVAGAAVAAFVPIAADVSRYVLVAAALGPAAFSFVVSRG